MYCLTDRELEVMRRYRQGDVLREEDKILVGSLRSIGLCSIGFTTESGLESCLPRPRRTARLTPTGVNILRYENIKRNFLTRFINACFSID